MKLIHKIFLFLVVIFITSTFGLKLSHEGINKDVQSYKMLFMYKHLDHVDPNNKLNLFTYKNILLSNDQLVVFESINEGDEMKDEKHDTSKYLITFRYEFLDTPCINGIYLCTLGEFTKEYKPIYPEINYDVPIDVTKQLGLPHLANENCIILPITPIMNVNEAAWICHPNIEVITEFQFKLSHILSEASILDYTFTSEYIKNKKEKHQGIVSINNYGITFENMQKNKILFSEWKDIEPYSDAIYLKENIIWEGEPDKAPEGGRCLKLFRKNEILNRNPDYFCIYIHRNDITNSIKLQIPQARFAANMYANKINIRLHKVLLRNSIETLAKDNKKIEIDSKILFPVKMEIRQSYLKQRHKIIAQVKLNKLKRTALDENLEKIKTKIIDKSCGSIDVCMRAINYCIDKKLLPLSGEKERFALDWQNPYHYAMPKLNLRIDSPNPTGIGEKILSVVNKLKGGKVDYFAETMPESPTGQLPNNISIMKAVNTISFLRENREYGQVSELIKNCGGKSKSGSGSSKRKLSYLAIADVDIFFDFLGKIRDKQFSK